MDSATQKIPADPDPVVSIVQGGCGTDKKNDMALLSLIKSRYGPVICDILSEFERDTKKVNYFQINSLTSTGRIYSRDDILTVTGLSHRYRRVNVPYSWNGPDFVVRLNAPVFRNILHGSIHCSNRRCNPTKYIHLW
jgi:hypothetical protein